MALWLKVLAVQSGGPELGLSTTEAAWPAHACDPISGRSRDRTSGGFLASSLAEKKKPKPTNPRFRERPCLIGGK